MFQRFHNRQLILFLGITLGLNAIIMGFGGKAERTFEKRISQLDTATVQSLIVQKGAQAPVTLSRAGAAWQVELPSGQTAATTDDKVARALATIANLEAQRLVSRSESDWADFDLADSSATRVQLLSGKGTLLDLYIGRFEYQASGMMTYVRRAEEEETYLVPGFLSASFGTTPNDWRDKTLLTGSSATWRRLAFVYPDEAAFTLVKDSVGDWVVEGETDLLLDQAAVSAYLSSIENLQGQAFADKAPGNVPPQQQLLINTTTGPITLSAWSDGPERWVLSSSENPGAYLQGEVGGLYEAIFVGLDAFIPDEEISVGGV